MRRGGKRGSPVVIRAQDLTNKPRIEYQGTNSNVLEIYVGNIVIQGLTIGSIAIFLDVAFFSALN